MKIAIQQPAYLPWQGYFALIDHVDEFVFLENVQYSKTSWDKKNRIIQNKKEIFLTIPVKTKGLFNQKVNEVELFEYKENIIRHLKIIKYSYSKCDFFKDYFYEFEKICKSDYKMLSELNKDLIKYLCKILNINTKFSDDSTYAFKTKKLDYIKDICIEKNCENYVSTLGSKNYIKNLKYIPNTQIKINFYDFKDLEYSQKTGKFISRLSILDLIFNLGPESLKYLRNNFFLCN